MRGNFYQLFVELHEWRSGECLMFLLWFHGKWESFQQGLLVASLPRDPVFVVNSLNQQLFAFVPRSFCERTNKKLCLLFRFNWQTSRVKRIIAQWESSLIANKKCKQKCENNSTSNLFSCLLSRLLLFDVVCCHRLGCYVTEVLYFIEKRSSGNWENCFTWLALRVNLLLLLCDLSS